MLRANAAPHHGDENAHVVAIGTSQQSHEEGRKKPEKEEVLTALLHWRVQYGDAIASIAAQSRHKARIASDLTAALTAAQHALDQQSEQVLGVLHDKDAHIRRLENDAASLRSQLTAVRQRQNESVPMGTRPSLQRDASMQCELGDSAFQRCIEEVKHQLNEREEQVSVLLDELEHVQAKLAARRTSSTSCKDTEAAQPATPLLVATTTRSVQTDGIVSENYIHTATQSSIATLQDQLHTLEGQNNDLLRQLQAQCAMNDTEKPRASRLELELMDAIHAMDAKNVGVGVVCLAGAGREKPTTPCLNIDHQISSLVQQRDHFQAELLALRSAWRRCDGMATTADTQTDSSDEGVERSDIQELARCPNRLAHLLQQLRYERMIRVMEGNANCAQDAKRGLLAHELANALRQQVLEAPGRSRERACASIVASIAREWMGWQDIHDHELSALQAQRAQDDDRVFLRLAQLKDYVHELEQQNRDLQARVNVLVGSPQPQRETIAGLEPTQQPPVSTVVSTVDANRRIARLEQTICSRTEQLWVAQRTIHALSSGSKRPGFQQGTSSSCQWVNDPNCDLEKSIDAFTNVSEYFTREKECLRLLQQLRERDEVIQQATADQKVLTLECHELRDKLRVCEASLSLAKTVLVGASMSKSQSWLESIERSRLLLLEDQIVDLRRQLRWSRGQILRLEAEVEGYRRQSCATNSVDSSTSQPICSRLAAFVSRLEHHHSVALACFSDWQCTESKVDSRKPVTDSTKQCCDTDITVWQQAQSDLRSDPTGTQARDEALMQRYRVLLTQYNDLCLHLQQLAPANPTATTLSSCVGHCVFGSNPKTTSPQLQIQVLTEKLHLLELLQRHTGAAGVTSDDMHMTLTPWLRLHASTQTETQPLLGKKSQDLVTGVSVGLQVEPVRVQEQGTKCGITDPHEMATVVSVHEGDASAAPLHPHSLIHNSHTEIGPTMTEDGTPPPSRQAIVAPLPHVAVRYRQLKERLRHTKKAHRSSLQACERLASQLEELKGENAALASKLKDCNCQRGSLDNVEKQTETASRHEMGAETMHASHQLSIREQENLELVRQLCEMKAKCFTLEQDGEALREQARRTEQERALEWDAYVSKINASLAAIEQEKRVVEQEKQELQSQVKTLQGELTEAVALLPVLPTAQPSPPAMRSCGTEMDAEMEASLRCDMETRIVLLQSQLDTARRDYDTLQETMNKLVGAHREELARLGQEADKEKAAFQACTSQLRVAFAVLEQEMAQYHAVRAHTEQEKAAPEPSRGKQPAAQAKVKAKRLTRSKAHVKPFAAGGSKVMKVHGKRMAVSPQQQQQQQLHLDLETKEDGKEMLMDLCGSECEEMPATETTKQWTTRLQASSWQVRVARQDEQLAVATRTNEDLQARVEQLEAETTALSSELRSRRSSEETLRASHTALSAECAAWKAQNDTLTQRLEEAAEELAARQKLLLGVESEAMKQRQAMQRKHELVTHHKRKQEALQQALDRTTQRATLLESVEHTLAVQQQQHREAIQASQQLRLQYTRQGEALKAATDECEGERTQRVALQARVKTLRVELTRLREQYRGSPANTGASTGVNGNQQQQPTMAMMKEQKDAEEVRRAMAEVKALKRRVLQKQAVLVGFRAKLVLKDEQIEMQQHKLTRLAEAHRALQDAHRDSQRATRQSVAELRQQMETRALATTARLDGLRASVYDACEVFVHCPLPWTKPPVKPTTPTSGSEEEDEGSDNQESDRSALLLAVSQHAHLSTQDLAALGMHSDSASGRLQRRCARLRGRRKSMTPVELQQRQLGGRRLLHRLEQALELSPQDCRAEISAILTWLCSGSEGAVMQRNGTDARID